MENKNYYPLRLASHRSLTYILTDTKTTNRHLDHEGCTGWVVAEGVPLILSKQLVDAYNYVHGCTSDKNKACIGGCMCCQSKGLAFSKGLPEDGEVEIQVPYAAIKHLKHMESCAVDGNNITRIDNYYHLVTHYGYEYMSDKMSGTALTVGFLPVMTGRPESVNQVDMRYAKGREKSDQRDQKDEDMGLFTEAPWALHPLIISDVEPSTSRYKVVKADDLLTDLNSVKELMDKVNAILKNQGLIVVFNKSIGLAWQELERKADVAIYKKENSAHSFTEGMDPHGVDIGPGKSEVISKERDTLEFQINFIRNKILVKDIPDREKETLKHVLHSLQSIKSWNESPAYHGKVDVEKVIEDLVEAIRWPKVMKSGDPIMISRPPEELLQNAEAAIGMLKALKEDRFKKESAEHLSNVNKHPLANPWTPEQVKEWMLKNPPQLKPKQISPEDRHNLISDMCTKFYSNPDSQLLDVSQANAIIYAIEKIIELKGL